MANKYSYLEGVMFYPFIFDQTDKFDRYSVALGLVGDQVKAARNLGLNVKQEDGKMEIRDPKDLRRCFDSLFNTIGGPLGRLWRAFGRRWASL